MGEATELLSVSCSHCGAPLQVPTGTRYLTCSYCNSRLELHESAGAIYTQELEKIGQATERIAEDVHAIRRENEIERLDGEWMIQREGMLSQGKDGRRAVPSAVGAVVGSAIAVVGGIIWTGLAASAGAPVPFVAFGVLFILVGFFMGVAGLVNSQKYADAEAEYQRRRAALLRQAEEQKQ